MPLLHPESEFTTVTWSTRRDGNDGYVLEVYRSGDQTDAHEFGPYPAHIIPAVVQGRRRIVAMRMDSEGRHYILPN